MSTIKKEIESRGSNVEAAIRTGLERLRVNREDVIVEVIDEGSRGLLGLGSREAVVRLKVVSYIMPEPQVPVPPKPEPRPEPKLQPRPEPKPESRPTPPREVAPREVAPRVVAPPPVPPPPAVVPPPVVVPPPAVAAAKPAVAAAKPAVAGEGDVASEGETAVSIITQLLELMAFSDVEITAELSEEDDLTRERINVIQIEGDDLGILIGPRGETLDSLQYISRIMVSHKRHERANFVVDVQKHRERRQLALTRLAERMAQKAIQRNQPVTLEPMPAHERRIIHMALRNSTQVYTNSAGEGERRRVKIFPK